MRKAIIFLFVLFILACSGKQEQTTTAQILQRRYLTGNRLMLTYRFNNGSRQVLDSVEISNRIIPDDSLKVIFTPGNPQKNHLVLP